MNENQVPTKKENYSLTHSCVFKKMLRRSQFLSDVREILGVPEWMLTVDNRKTKVLHNGACIQLLFHFKGTRIDSLQIKYRNLIALLLDR